MTPRPRVSIGFPVYNGEALVERALSCLRAQTYADLEIVVSDNASDDCTPELLRRHAALDARIRIHRLDEHIDVWANFVRVLQLAEGHYFMWAAHDDAWEADHVERLVLLLDADERVVLAAGVALPVTRDGEILREPERLLELERESAVEGAMAFLAQPERDGKAHVVYGLYRRDALLAVDPASIWNGDPWRTDYHLLFAVLCRGLLRIDPAVRYTKTERDPRERHLSRRELVQLARSTVRAHAWVARYRPVAVEQGVLNSAEMARLRRIQRRRHVALIGEHGHAALSALRRARS